MTRKLLVVIALLMFVFCTVSAHAADEREGTVVDGSLLTNKTQALSPKEDSIMGKYLSHGSGSIKLVAKRQVSVSGSTACFSDCDEVKVTLSIQRLEGSTWVTEKPLGTKIAYNAHYVSKSGTYSVEGGYYYRLKGSHVAKEGSTTESTSSATEGLWVP